MGNVFDRDDENQEDRVSSEYALIGMRLGLKEATVADLVAKGWVYREELGKTRHWVGPESQILTR